MECYYKIVPHILWPTLFRDECQTKRCRMSLHFYNWWSLIKARILYVDIFIEVCIMNIFSEAVGPAVIFAFFQNIDFVRRYIISQQIAAHVCPPHPTINITPIKKDGVTKT